MLNRAIRLFPLAGLAALALSACSSLPGAEPPLSEGPDWRTVKPDHLVQITTETGTITIELLPEAAPKHVAQFQKAVRTGLYNNEYFYRVIEGHVAQAGLEFDQRLSDWAALPFEAERARKGGGFRKLGNPDLYAANVGFRAGVPTARFGETEWPLHCPGAVGMARDEDIGSGKIEFYIPLAPRRYLDRNYTVFARVIDGIEHVHRLARVDPTPEDDVAQFFSDRPDSVSRAFSARAARLASNRIKLARLASDMPEAARPQYEVMNTSGPAFTKALEEQRDRTGIDAFPVDPPKVIDICSVRVPIRLNSGQ